MLKRMISMFLCIAIFISLLPVQTIALETEELTTQILETEPVEEKTEPVEDEVDPLEEEPTEDETEPVEEECELTQELEQIEQEPVLSDDSIIASGTCGDNLTWELDKGGKLTISGTGEMSYYTSTKQVPWYNYAYFISEISLPEGLGSIAGYSFANCHSVKSITIPESVYIIYGNAFLYTGITSLTIPKNVASIDIMCFQSCYDLKEITVDPENEYYCSVDGIMFSKDLSTLHYYPCGMSGETFTVPDNITTIGDFAFFSCTNLKNIELPDGLSEIGFAAFQGAGFKTITIPASIDYIDGYAFFSCDELTDVYFTGTEEQWNTLVENRLGPDNNSLLNATIHCSGDAAPTEPEETESTEPEDDTIRGTCGANLTWALKDGVLTISGTGDMSFDSAYEAPWQVYAGRITEIVLETGVTSVAEGAFAVCRMESITIPEGVLSIGDSAFDSCKNLTSIILPDSLTSIGFNAFSHTPLTGVTIPENVSNIGAGAFQYCTKLTSITVDEKNPNYYSVDGVLFENAWNRLHTYPAGKAGELYCVPEGIKRIGDSAFTGCSNLIHIEVPEGVEYMQWLIGVDNLTGIVLPSSLSYIAFQMFEYCDNLTDIYYTGTEEQWDKLLQATNSTENPSLFDGSITVHCNWTGEPEELPTLPEGIIAEGTCGPTATWTLTETGTLTISGTGMVTEAPWYDNYHAQITNVTVADGITSICEYAFADCNNLTKITVPASVDQISVGAFLNCTGITSAGPIGSGADYEFGWTSSIPSGAFCYLSGLSKITWPDSLTSIGDSAFLLCGFTKVVIPKGVKTIGDKAFADCASLKRLAIPSTADSVGEYAFLNCAQLEDVFIMSKSITIGKGAFMEASAVSNVFCAVSERNVEKIVLMEGNDPLINAEKYFDWNDSMETRVLIRRHGIWHDAVEEQLTLSVESNEYIDIRIILGMDNSYDGAVTFELTQNNQQLLSNQSGRFEEFSYPDYLSKDSLVSVFVYDFSDNVIYQEEMNLRIVDSYSVTFVHYDGETETDSFSSGEKITAPPEYDRPGFIFKGWYTSPSFEGMEFFDEMNFWSREKIEQDITLYQKWESSDLDLSKDVWPFGNLEEWFVESDDGHYEITDADFNELVNSLDGDSTDISNINKKRYREWGGSCFGLSSAVVLSKAGKVNIQNFPEGDTTYYTLKTAFTTKNTDPTQPGNIESLINFLHLRQYIGDIHDLIFGYKDEEETTNARNMIDKMKASDGLFVLTITIEKMFESDADHSVVAYDFTEISSGQYSFSVWDCNDPGGVYTIEISDSGVISCAEWEDFYRTGLEKDNEIFIDLYFGSLLSCEDLMVRRILEKPETLMSDTYAILRGTDIENTANTYCIETNYDDFAISNGIDTAVISDGEKISGNLDIYCNGFVGIPGAYQFEVPVLETGTSYTISQTSDGALNTLIHYDDSVYGFLICQDAENAGIVQFNGEGRISTEYENEVLQTVSVTYNNMTAPWYTVDIKGCSKGIAAALKDGIVEVESKTEMVADFTVGTVFNEIVIPGIILNGVVTKVEEGENRTCSITRNSEIVTTNTYGFSVIFDSQMGTAITSLPNVSSGTKVDEPTSPTRPGYLFEGWFKDTAEYTEPWDFATDTVTEDLVLYAGWSVDPNYMKSVTFRMSGKDDQIVYMPVNSLIPADYAPAVAEGETILWFADRACTELWNFETDTLTGNLILYGQVENRVTVAAADLDAQTSVWIDGEEYSVQTVGDNAYIDLPDETATNMIAYTYHVGDSTDIHTLYPVGMKVWTLKNENGFYTATRDYELDNILKYSGTSIRVTGKQGIRMITSIDKSKKDSLTSDGLAGYTLKEYGTVVAWASQLENGNPLVLGQPYVMSNYAYKKGIADPVFAYDGNLMQYTNVLVGFSLDQCKDDLAMRPYMILTDTAGKDITLYGGIVQRSIGYIAQQNANTFDPVTEAGAYNFIRDIIRHVYGEDYVPQAA